MQHNETIGSELLEGNIFKVCGPMAITTCDSPCNFETVRVKYSLRESILCGAVLSFCIALSQATLTFTFLSAVTLTFAPFI